MKETAKQIIIGVIILVLAMTIYSYFFVPDTGYKIKSMLSDLNIGEISPSNSEVFVECPKEIIPENISLTQTSYLSFSADLVLTRKWADGVKIEDSVDSNGFVTGYGKKSCPVGSSEGQNTNYRYCSPMDYHRTDKEINSDGNILSVEKIYYKIRLVLQDEIVGEEPSYTPAGDKIIEYGNVFEVVDSSCELIQENKK